MNLPDITFTTGIPVSIVCIIPEMDDTDPLVSRIAGLITELVILRLYLYRCGERWIRSMIRNHDYSDRADFVINRTMLRCMYHVYLVSKSSFVVIDAMIRNPPPPYTDKLLYAGACVGLVHTLSGDLVYMQIIGGPSRIFLPPLRRRVRALRHNAPAERPGDEERRE